MDQNVFDEEQAHLDETYAKLQDIERATRASLEKRIKAALGDKNDMLDELAVDFTGEVNLETYVEFESINKIIDEYNLSNELDQDRLNKAHVLLKQPYFAKITLQMKPGAEPRDLYIGTTGITDEKRRHFIIDWRSPVAEVYYNQSTGKTSYEANGRTIQTDLKLRRQFDITGNKLNAYFDTTVAIEDPLLLASLAQAKSDTLRDITATIQKEQNAVVRHEDVPVLLVNGIAGSGKTSVLLQRIAYLFYRERENLRPSDVYLITPNPVFQKYISEVLPNMGETNPSTLTWNDLMNDLGIGEHGLGKDASADTLRLIDKLVPNLELTQADFQDLRIDEERVITASQIFSCYNHFKKFPAGTHRSTLTVEELHDKVQQRIQRLANDEYTQDTVTDLDEETMVRVFGHHIIPMDDAELRDYTRQYLTWRYRPIEEAIENGEWLRIDRIGMNMLEKKNLTSAEHLYLKLTLAGCSNRAARYVMVDEVQDYTQPQLMVLARYFNNAHFLLLGDPNQAITPGTATFEQIREIFSESHKHVDECQLMTSYRSSPEITELFTRLMTEEERINANSVQRDGTPPVILECNGDEEYRQALIGAVSEAKRTTSGLTAIVTADKMGMKRAAKILDDPEIMKMDGSTNLPESGVILLTVALAKGLEFDRVIVPDAQNRAYEDPGLSSRRLYTAISRATQHVTLLSNGPLSELLK